METINEVSIDDVEPDYRHSDFEIETTDDRVSLISADKSSHSHCSFKCQPPPPKVNWWL